ncbi:hypothetical protein ACJMK2_020226 [Sinanodonta woodiana]|uniref:Uncharacterized protein n=1 Tax=Sinanodonta woodiana TaxID=1069815 RepID=A0ABD3TYE7_SINWO
MLPQILTKLNIGTILSYFLETRADFKAMRESIFELFTYGHALAHMKQQFYRVIVMLIFVGDIINASCSCPAGSGHNCSCNIPLHCVIHLTIFFRVFGLPGGFPSCTDKLEAWNKLGQVKPPAVHSMIYTLQENSMEKRSKQFPQLKGEYRWLISFIKIVTPRELFAKSFLFELANAILKPSNFSSVAMKYVLDMEQIVINRYVTEKNKEGSNISIKISSPDGGVEEINSLVGIVEFNVAVKWSHAAIIDSSFVKYCDLTLLHSQYESFHCQRFEFNQEWVDKFLPKLETFLDDYMADRVLQNYKEKKLLLSSNYYENYL